MNINKIKKILKDNNIKGYSKLKKDELLNLLKENNINIEPEKKEDENETEKLRNRIIELENQLKKKRRK